MALKPAPKKVESGLWPEEIEAWKKIDGGETEMTTKTAEQFQADMKRYMDERKKREVADKRTKRLAKTAR